jgi:hypothetical protein
MDASLQQVFQSHYPAYRRAHKVSLEQHKAAVAIMRCSSEAMGQTQWTCTEDEHREVDYHCCRHRSCPRCHGTRTRQWLEMIEQRLLPCDHFHVVFTLPHELNALWCYNRAWSADHLFRAGAETLQQLLDDERHLSATVGMLASLHTWGRTLSFHPHVHVLVTGGGLTGGEWRSCRRDYLLPAAVLKAKFRGKWLAWLNAAYAKGDLILPPEWDERRWLATLRAVARKDWNVRIQGGYRHGHGVAVYLSRYARGGPIKDSRLTAVGPDTVCFLYHDHHDGRAKQLSLNAEHFLQRVLWHVPVKGQHNLRYYGLYVPGAAHRRALARQALGAAPEVAPDSVKRPRNCPRCGHPLRRCAPRYGKISLTRVPLVQQDVQADPTNVPPARPLDATSTSPPFFGPGQGRLTQR